MKTAMQELLEWVRRTLPMDLDFPIMIEDKIELLLEKEKEQIKNTYREGLQEGLSIDVLDENADYVGEEEYYNEKYK